MACYHPIPARRVRDGPWELNPPLHAEDAQVNCGHCIGCRADKAYEWTNRAVHESRLWGDNNRFLTLTYDDEHDPGELQPYDLQTFLKRLRRATTSTRKKNAARKANILSDRSASIRYMACGEYGEKTLRAHYHLCIFNCGFADEIQYDKDLRESPTLTKIWGNGSVKIGDFTPQTAAYVAGYTVKNGPRKYYDADKTTGKIYERFPPFRRQSNRPAIGKTWLDRYATDLQHGYLITEEGTKARIPRYYTKQLLAKHSKIAQAIQDRKAQQRPWNENNHPERRKAQEIIHQAQQQQKGRILE